MPHRNHMPPTHAKSHRQALAAWLDAEGAADDRGAEWALREAFDALPQAVPSPEFSDRVLTAAGVGATAGTTAGTTTDTSAAGWSALLGKAAGWRGQSWSFGSRMALASCLVLVAVSSSFFLPAALEVLNLLTATEVITGVVDSGLAVGNRLQDIQPLWQLAKTLYGTLLHVVTSPPILLALLTLTLLSSAALRSLLSLLPARRSYGYA